MRIEYLEYLIDFSETSNISKTATRFFMSYQGMSRALHELEKELGEPLFSYSGRSVSLNDFGRMYVESVRPTVESYHQSQRHLVEYKERRDARSHELMYMYFTPTAGRSLLPLLTEYYRFRPYIRLRESSMLDVGDEIRSSYCGKTVGVVTLPSVGAMRESVVASLEKDDDMVFSPFAKTDVVVLVSSSSAFAKDRTFQYCDLGTCKVGCLNDTAAIDVVDESVINDNLYVTGVWSVLIRMIANNRIVMPVPKLALAQSRIPSDSDGNDLVEGPVYATLMRKRDAGDPDIAEAVKGIADLFMSDEIKAHYADYYAPIEQVR